MSSLSNLHSHRPVEGFDWLPKPRRHGPLLWLTALMGVLTLVLAVLAVAAPTEITGTNGWFKPLKFSLSIAIYAATMVWLLGLLPRNRWTWGLGTVVAVGMFIEIVIIAGAAALGTTSHFTMTSPAQSLAWAAMGISVVVVWVAMMVIAGILFRTGLPGAGRARVAAVRAGLLLAIVGMGLAFLMTQPTAAQLAAGEGILGAHTVGIPDGGPGLPFLGWSTVAGDLRIGHFLGLHGLQALPLLALLLEAVTHRVPALRDDGIRTRLVWVGASSYLGLTLLVTGQALAAEPVTDPSPVTLAALLGLLVATLGAGALVLARAGARPQASST